MVSPAPLTLASLAAVDAAPAIPPAHGPSLRCREAKRLQLQVMKAVVSMELLSNMLRSRKAGGIESVD